MSDIEEMKEKLAEIEGRKGVWIKEYSASLQELLDEARKPVVDLGVYRAFLERRDNVSVELLMLEEESKRLTSAISAIKKAVADEPEPTPKAEGYGVVLPFRRKDGPPN